MRYNVVFERTDEKNKGYRSWSGFESRSQFERYFFTTINGIRPCDISTIVAEGIPFYKAVEICIEANSKLL